MTNGIIVSYQIQYGVFDGEDRICETLNLIVAGNETFDTQINSLEEYVEYGFQVRAITVAPGPFTGLALNTTFQAGKH